ncbi:EAL domain-containing protein [Arthrobacter echini]|uniref:EAL domain-containing protein n=1 Tax=Arthrobacter echini TaxID=1529066 RepID=A0A4S5E8I1_9MICC|nr:EAL domain-containing protein [Arthrobacter echini]THJ67976.1 EAL domain-containing protein [Arthrobacter echini]
MQRADWPRGGSGVPGELFIRALKATSEISLITDAQQRVLYVSESFVSITGYSREEVLGTNCRMLQGPGTDPETTAAMRDALASGNAFEGEILNYRKDGSAFWNALRITPLYSEDGQLTHFVSTQRDINTRMALLEQLRFQALHDQVTGLPNRVGTDQRVGQVVRAGCSAGTVAAVGVIDLDDFRAVNNTYGHAAGDLLLREWASRFQGRLRDEDFLGRMGGDEFALILHDIPRADPKRELKRLLEPLTDVVGSPFMIDGEAVLISMSMGVALVEDGRSDAAGVLRAADEALYAVKQRKADRTQWWEIGAGAADEVSGTRSGYDTVQEPPEAFGRACRRALDTGVVVHLQPVVNLREGTVHLFEALARLDLPGEHLMAPAEFLPHFDETDLVRLFRLVLDQALEQFSRWSSAGVRAELSVNLPPTVLKHPGLLGFLSERLAHHGVEPQRLTLELLESGNLDSEVQREVLLKIVRLGIGLAMDDLGAGYSSLNRLSSLPFNSIKLDQELLAGIHSRPTDVLSMIAALIQLGRDVGKTVVIEGIEERGVAEAVTILGAALGQGYYFSPPLPGDEVPAFASRFNESLSPDRFRTHLGALAYHWQFARLGSPHARALQACPLSHFLSAMGSPAGVERWHAQQHDGRAVHLSAGRLMVDWFVQQVCSAAPSDTRMTGQSGSP